MKGSRRGLSALVLALTLVGIVSEARADNLAIAAPVEGVPSFHWPLSRPEVVNFYGWRRRRVHEGLDLRASVGTPIYAAARGIVIHAGRGLRGYGQLVVIDHGRGWSSIYAHLSKVAVRVGERVSGGDAIGDSGRTGKVKGPHLHFEIRKGADPLDPLVFLRPSYDVVKTGRIHNSRSISNN